MQLVFVHRQGIQAVVEQGRGFVQDAGAGEDADADQTGVEVQVLQPAVEVRANHRAVRGRGVQLAGKGGEALARPRRAALTQPFGKVTQHQERVFLCHQQDAQSGGIAGGNLLAFAAGQGFVGHGSFLLAKGGNHNGKRRQMSHGCRILSYPQEFTFFCAN